MQYKDLRALDNNLLKDAIESEDFQSNSRSDSQSWETVREENVKNLALTEAKSHLQEQRRYNDKKVKRKREKSQTEMHAAEIPLATEEKQGKPEVGAPNKLTLGKEDFKPLISSITDRIAALTAALMAAGSSTSDASNSQ